MLGVYNPNLIDNLCIFFEFYIKIERFTDVHLCDGVLLIFVTKIAKFDSVWSSHAHTIYSVVTIGVCTCAIE